MHLVNTHINENSAYPENPEEMLLVEIKILSL